MSAKNQVHGWVLVLVLVAVTVSLMGMSGCGKQEPAPKGPGGGAKETRAVVNVKCPIMGNPVKAKSVPVSLTRVYSGKTVGFCCAACLPA